MHLALLLALEQLDLERLEHDDAVERSGVETGKRIVKIIAHLN